MRLYSFSLSLLSSYPRYQASMGMSWTKRGEIKSLRNPASPDRTSGVSFLEVGDGLFTRFRFGRQCPYCKISFEKEPWSAAGQPRVVCLNCRNHYDIEKREREETEERELFKKYWAIPINWKDYESWRGDPYYALDNKNNCKQLKPLR